MLQPDVNLKPLSEGLESQDTDLELAEEIAPPPPLSDPKDSDLKIAYGTWQTEPTPGNLRGVVNRLQSTISYSLASLNVGNDPYLKMKASMLAANAVKSYDPNAGSALHTWVSSQLRPLGRERRLHNAPIKIPERVQLDARRIYEVESEFQDKHNRDPDLHELADAAKMSVAHIQKVRKAFLRTTSQSAMGEQQQFATEDDSDEVLTAADFIYDTLNHTDRKLLEYTTGYGGGAILSGNQIREKLKLTPVQLSRRRDAIAKQLQEVSRVLETTNRQF